MTATLDQNCRGHVPQYNLSHVVSVSMIWEIENKNTNLISIPNRLQRMPNLRDLRANVSAVSTWCKIMQINFFGRVFMCLYVWRPSHITAIAIIFFSSLAPSLHWAFSTSMLKLNVKRAPEMSIKCGSQWL